MCAFPSRWYPLCALKQSASITVSCGMALQPGSVDGQVGALRHVRLGALGFVEQLEALDNDRRLL